jgi:hypothetical protein
VKLSEEASTPTGFMRIAHVAWLAQALYRVRRGGFEPPELTQAFFGDLHSPEAPLLIEAAWRAMSRGSD